MEEKEQKAEKPKIDEKAPQIVKKKKKIIKSMKPRKWEEGDQMKLFGYCRCSTDKQVIDGLSIEMQDDAIRKFCKEKKYNLVEMFRDDGIMGATEIEDRPEMKALMFKLNRNEAHGIIIYKLDRLCRSSKIYANLAYDLQKEGRFLMVVVEGLDTSTPHGRFHAQMMMSIAELEKEMIVTRTKESIAYKKANNMCIGAVPFGKKRIDTGKFKYLVDDDEQQKTISLARELRGLMIKNKAGRSIQMTYNHICDKLVELGRKNNSGNVVWHPSNVRRIVLGDKLLKK